MTLVSGNLGEVPLGLIAPHLTPPSGNFFQLPITPPSACRGGGGTCARRSKRGLRWPRPQGTRLPRPHIRTLFLAPRERACSVRLLSDLPGCLPTGKGACLFLPAVQTRPYFFSPCSRGDRKCLAQTLPTGTPKGRRPHSAFHTSPMAWLRYVTGRGGGGAVTPHLHENTDRGVGVCCPRALPTCLHRLKLSVCFEGNRVLTVSCCLHLQE